ncbi:hypothetical protein ACED66_10090 [Vibrio splendidus]|jgi:hypothetical protein|nr:MULTISPECIES: hypothetical protein [Vibrio]TCW21088.1 hypothetical protein EDB48_103446 [Vibrio crassostreae]UOE79516.1 hypothetical protein LTQ03_13725 [Vibrio splendidus]|tara:strand:- start:448 stop:909 length:462 start_codon:yes stop_codon:yes gene_type:complete
MKKLIYSLLIILSTSAHSASQDWMKKENPTSLGLYVFASNECTFSSNDVERRIKGEFVRAGIKPTAETSLFINVEYICLPQRSVSGHVRGNSIHMDVKFGTQHSNGEYVLYTSKNYGTLAQGGTDYDSTQYFIDELTQRASNALTDFLLANLE